MNDNINFISLIGSGAYGYVYKVKLLDSLYAFKYNKVFSETNFIVSIRELNILRLLNHPNIVSLKLVIFKTISEKKLRKINKKLESDNLLQENNDSFLIKMKSDNIHFMFELADYDILDNIENFTLEEIYKISYDILLAIDYLHENKIIHCDIKPQNILWFRKSQVAKLCDFGMICHDCKLENKSKEVVSSWYRAPEIASKNNYGISSDIWSYGCVLFELFYKKALFYEADSSSEIIERIIKIFPSENWIKEYNLKKDDLVSRKDLRKNLRKKRYKILKSILINSVNSNILDILCDFLSKLLDPNKDTRINSKKSLKHEFFQTKYLNINKEKINNIKYLKIINNTSSEILIKIKRKKSIYNIVKSFYFKKTLELTVRMMFHSISIFDLYINTIDINKRDIEILYYSCLYISYKYFRNIGLYNSFSEICKKSDFWYKSNYNKILKYEIDIIEYICNPKKSKNNLYQHTLYEEYSKIIHENPSNYNLEEISIIKKSDIFQLLSFYSSINVFNGTLEKLMRKFINEKIY